MINKKTILILLLLLSLLGWYFYPGEADQMINAAFEEKRKHPERNVFDGFKEPEIPSTKGDRLFGVDANKNGIRDDVEIWINRNWHTYNERMAVRQLAGDLQYRLEAALENEREKIAHATSVAFTTYSCLRFIFRDVKKREETESLISKIVYNTSGRKDILENFNNFNYGYGSVVPGMKLNEPYLGCRFKIQNETKLINDYNVEINKGSI